ncbi:MAG: hypothetical protein ACJAYC_002371 [Halieaceae bacterium]|jgi:hypothetical protein
MTLILKVLKWFALSLALIIAGYNLWGFLTLGTIEPASPAQLEPDANRTVMVFGASGSVGDGMLKAAIEDPDVEKIYVVTRRTTPRVEAGVASGKVVLRMHQDYTDYNSLSEELKEVNTVLWGLGASSIGMDDKMYTWIHVDFPVAFIKAWLASRTEAPMSFHSVTGKGTDPNGSAHWAREKGRAELEVADLAQGSGLRTYAYRSALVRPTSERSNIGYGIAEALLRPGSLVITARNLGAAMLEISARTKELPNGTLIDAADSIAYARAYRNRLEP